MTLAKNIIQRALVEHGESLAAMLAAQAIEARHDARNANFASVTRAADSMARDCDRAREWAQRYFDLSAGERAACIVADRCGVLVVALGAAGKLLGLDRDTIREAAGEWEANAEGAR